MQWIPKQFWTGMDVFVIGGGDSLRASGFDWNRLSSKLTIGCNDAYQLGPVVCNICVFGDLKWWHHHRDALEKFPNPVFTNQPSLHANAPDWLLSMSRLGHGISRTQLGWNHSTGSVGINLALALGAQRVCLIGFDMKLGKTGRANWHDHNVHNPNIESYNRFAKGFKLMARNLPTVFPGREIINLGPDSDLECFPKANLDDYL